MAHGESIELIPRISGRIGEIEEPLELKGKWTFEVFMGFIGHGEPEKIFMGPAFNTRYEADAGLMDAVQLCLSKIKEKYGVPDDGAYIDLKTNELKVFKNRLN